MKRVYQGNNNLNAKSSIYSSSSSLNSTNITPTFMANQNGQIKPKNESSAYSFAGVHHIFNNHKM